MIGRRTVMVAALVGLGVSAPTIVLAGGGTTTAEFGVNHTLGGNRVETATLDIEVGQSIAEISAAAMAPGDSHELQVVLRNAGSLPLAFRLRMLPNNSALAAELDWEQWDGPCADRPAGSPASTTLREPVPNHQIGDGEPVPDDQLGDGEPRADTGLGRWLLGIGEETTICVSAILPLDVSNDLQAAVAGYDVIVDAVHDLDPPGLPEDPGGSEYLETNVDPEENP